MKKFYLSTPIYYVNDKPHIGHAYTTVAADILARWHKIQGQDVFFLTGTDEHGAKVAESAEKAGKEPQAFCDEMAQYFQKAWQNLKIKTSDFIRTTNPDHQKAVIKFLARLKEKDFLYEKDYSGLYCIGCEKFITEKELVDGKCPDHNREPEKVTEKNWFFKLKQFLPEVENLISEDRLLIRPENAKREVLGLFKQGLEDFSISRQKVAWGIKVPWDQTQTFYVWIDALLNYWTAIQKLGRRKFWPPDLHLIGRDILKFHAVYWPAMLAASGEELPRKIFIHGYFTVNGKKMSKTLGNVIDPNALVEKYGADATRHLLFSQFPFGQDGDISENKLIERYNADLANGLGNLVARVAKFGIKSQESKVKKAKLAKYNALLGELKFLEVIKLIRKKIQDTNNTIEKEKPWEIYDPKTKEKIIQELIAKILVIAQMVKPFMPEKAKEIFEVFRKGKSKILFPRIE